MTDARTIADRARSCPGVAGLSGGPFGVVATYLPGERITGVSVTDDEVAIAIVARLTEPLPEAEPLPDTADRLRQAVADLTGDRRVNVRIHDVVEESR
ncbi:hypothetical protein ABT294_23840 [Nonomuraea sp. NPDC000554]|uniref:hypothetical protein n=1 Tax=Nonomuraea sp. NPDC000554 TaxID=3154259 RepID=UPI003325EC64